MPVFRVSITVEAVVQANNEKKARLDGYDALRLEIENRLWHEVEAAEVKEKDDLPEGWDLLTLVYHDGYEDLTVAEALAKAPEPGATGAGG